MKCPYCNRTFEPKIDRTPSNNVFIDCPSLYCDFNLSLEFDEKSMSLYEASQRLLSAVKAFDKNHQERKPTNVKKPEFVDWEKEDYNELYSQTYTVEEWKDAITSDCIIDEDGCGVLATAEKKSNIRINPSDLLNGYKLPYWVTHIIWYNR